MIAAERWCAECADAVPHRLGECFGQRRPAPEDRNQAGNSDAWIRALQTYPEARASVPLLKPIGEK